MAGCEYLRGFRTGEPLEHGDRGRVTNWAEWTEFECTNSEALNEGGCPYLDDHNVECPLKENQIGHIHDFAIRTLAGDRKDRYTRVREFMLEAEG